LLIFSI